MPALYSGALSRLPATLALALLTLALFAACDNGNDGAPAIDTAEPTADATAPSSAESLKLPSEMGEEPVYWRTQDNFQSVRAGEPYKIVLRVTNGYDEETLPVLADREGGGDRLDFTASRAEPVGPEDPGTFYVFELLWPRPGAWEMTVRAGDDEATISVRVQPAAPSTRY